MPLDIMNHANLYRFPFCLTFSVRLNKTTYNQRQMRVNFLYNFLAREQFSDFAFDAIVTGVGYGLYTVDEFRTFANRFIKENPTQSFPFRISNQVCFESKLSNSVKKKLWKDNERISSFSIICFVDLNKYGLIFILYSCAEQNL